MRNQWWSEASGFKNPRCGKTLRPRFPRLLPAPCMRRQGHAGACRSKGVSATAGRRYAA